MNFSMLTRLRITRVAVKGLLLACFAGAARDAIAAAPSATGAAPAAPRFTLTDAVTAMNRAHPLLTAARASRRAAELDATAAGLWTNPQLNITYGRSVGYTSFDPILGSAQIGVSQLIETAGVPSARRRAAELERDAVRTDGEGLRRRLIVDIQQAFFSLAGALERHTILSETLARLERAGAIVRARVGSGVAPRYHASRITLAIADAHAAVGEAEADIAAARGSLDVAVGPEASMLQGAPEIALYEAPPLPPSTGLVDMMRSSSAELSSARLRAQAALAEVDVVRRSVFQGVSVYGGVAVGQGIGPKNERQVDVIVGVTLPLPMVDRGQNRVSAAQSRADVSGLNLEALILGSEQRVRAAYAEAARRRQAVEEYRVAASTASSSMIGEVEAAYKEGRLSVLELVDAYTSMRDARLRLAALAVDARIADANLWRAAGLVSAR